MDENDIWNKPERFGDQDVIYIRQYKVNTTGNLKTVGGHAILTEMEMWVPGWGVTRAFLDTNKAPKGLELIDQTLPIGSPWPQEEKKPHVPQKIPYNRKTRAYPGPLKIFALLYGWHTPVMYAAMQAYEDYCDPTGKNKDRGMSGTWTGNFWQWLRYGPWKDHPAWERCGHVGPEYVQRLKPMLEIITAVRDSLKVDFSVEKS